MAAKFNYASSQSKRSALFNRGVGLSAVFFALVLLLAPHPSFGQIIYGSIVGTVTDATGAVVPNAIVKAVQTETDLTRQTQTDNSGGYKISTLPAGRYSVTVSGQGFGNTLINDVQVTPNTDSRADASLKLGTATASVTVTDQLQGLQTDRAEVRTELTSKEVTDLPLPGRNFEALLGTVPGVNPPRDEVGMGSVNNPSRSMAFSGNGSNNNTSNVAIEGVSSANSWIQELASYIPAEDSIQSVDITTGSFNAEQGNAGGVAVNVQLKSGTNAFHGTAFEQYTGSRLQTLPRFGFSNAAARGLRNPQLVENQYGGTIGGPILKNKLFFFFSAEQLSDHETQVNTATVPTLYERQGYFLQTATNNVGIYDPKTGDQTTGIGRTLFPLLPNPLGCVGCPAGNYFYVNPNRWDPATTKYLAAIPAPNNPDGTLQGNNYSAIGPYRYSSTKYDGKLDFNLTDRLHLNYRLSLLPFTENVPSMYGVGPAGGPPVSFTGQSGITTGNVTSNSISGIYTFSPKLVLDANVGYTYLKTNQTPPLYGQNYGTDTLGIPNANGPDPINSGVPQFTISGFALDYGTWYSAIRNHNPNETVQGNLTWSKGSHNMRFGGNWSKVDLNIAEDLFGYSNFRYNGGSTSSNGIGGGFQGVNSLADFLLGQTYEERKRVLNTTYSSLRTTTHYVYAQDQWQVNKKLTFNYGIRWNFYPVPVRAHSGIELFNPTTDTNAICGRGGVALNCGINVSKKLFSPLAGIAYRLDDKSVLRAGGGINFDPISMFRDGLENYPSQTGYDFLSNTNSGYIAYGLTAAGLPASTLNHADLTQASYVLPNGVSNSSNLLPNSYKRGYTESWNLTLERDLGQGWTIQAGYVAARVIHGQVNVNLNTASNFGTATIVQNPKVPGGTIQPVSAAPLPYSASIGTNGYNVQMPLLRSNYNSLQSTLKHTFRSGYLITANYTWSRHIGINGPIFPQATYFYLNRSVLGDDRTNNINVTFLGELPFGKGKPMLRSGLGAAIAGGWQVNSIVTATSGTPFTVGANNNFNANGIGTNWADKVKAGSPKGSTFINSSGSIDNYINYSYYADPTTDCSTYNSSTQPYCPQRFGTSGLNSLRGPGIFNADISLSRKFKVGDRVGLKITADAFNATNTPHLNNPNVNISNYGPNPASSDGLNGNFGQITGVTPFGGRFGLDQRQIKLGAHIEF